MTSSSTSSSLEPVRPGFSLLPEEADRPLTHLRLQIPQHPPAVSVGLKLLREFLLTLPPSVSFSVWIRPTVNEGRFMDLLRRWDETGPDRVRLIPSWHVRNLFARDNAMTGVSAQGDGAILLPRKRSTPEDAGEDPQEVEAVRGFGYPVRRSSFHWDGGNILFDGHQGLVGANTVAENMIRLEMEEGQVLEGLTKEFGVPLAVLGNVVEAREILTADLDGKRPDRPAEGGQADFHLDLDVALLGKVNGQPTAVVADPEAGLELLPAILEKEDLFQDHYLPPREMRAIYRDDLLAAAAVRKPRLEAYRRSLASLGYQVHGIPDVRLMDESNHLGRVNTRFNYCNVLPGSLDGRPSVLLFAFGIPELDGAAFRLYRQLGVGAVPLAADGVTPGEVLALGGGVHCLTSPLA